MTGSILSRSTLSASYSLTSTQSQVDGLVGGFTAQATDWRSLAAMMAGGVAYRVGRVGIMGLGSGNALRAASVGIGLSAEVAAFEGAHRSLTALSGESHLNPNLFRWNGNGGLRQGLLHSFVTFGTLKAGGRLAQGQNLIAQHLLQDSAMVLGHQVTGAMNIAPRPTGSLAEQFLHAEATNLQLGAGMALAGRLAPGVHSLERGLDLSLRATEGGLRSMRPGEEVSPPQRQPAFAMAGNSESVPNSPSARENTVSRPWLSQMSSTENEGGRESGVGGSLDSKAEHPLSDRSPVTTPASPRALEEAKQAATDSGLPSLLESERVKLGGTFDLINRLWTASETDARPAFIELDRRSTQLSAEENHILTTVLELGLNHAEARRRVVSLTALATLGSRVVPWQRFGLVEKIFPRLSDTEFEVRSVATNALLYLGLSLNPAEISQLNRNLAEISLLEGHPARNEVLPILASHYPHLPEAERPSIGRAIVEGFVREGGLGTSETAASSSPSESAEPSASRWRGEPALRLIMRHLPVEQHSDFLGWLSVRFSEQRDEILQTYERIRAEPPSEGTPTVPPPETAIRGPEIMTRTIFPISPRQTVVTLGEGAGITPMGSWRTTRRVAMGDADAIAHKAEDAGLVRYAGLENGQTQWRDMQTGQPISLSEIESRWGSMLGAKSGIRDLERLPFNDRTRDLSRELLREMIGRLPVGSERRNLLVHELEKLEKHPIDSMVADFGGVVPSYMRDTLFEKMGMTFEDIGKTRIGGAHYANVLKTTSDQVRLYLYGATEVLNQLGGRLPDLYPHSRKVGFAFGAAFEGYDALIRLIDTHRRGGNFKGLDTPLPDALISHAPAVLANMLGPQFNYRMAKRSPEAIRGIVPPNMDPKVGPNTMGPIYTEVAACASAFYALAAGANALTGNLPGQWRPELFLLGASDAALSPLANPFLITAFSDVAPISRARLRELGLTPAQASMPLNLNASGLVFAEAAGGIGLSTLYHGVAKRQMISAIMAGWGLSLGEGGKEMLMGMDEGSVSAALEAINMGIEGHGLSIRDIGVVQLHGTSTRLNNIAEMISLYKIFAAYGGERARPMLNALKGLIGHAMGAASMIDLLNAVATLREQRAPRLFNFSMENVDERFSDTSKTLLPEDLTSAFRFPTQSVSTSIEAVLGISEGFGSRSAAVLLRRFDPSILRHFEWESEMKPEVENFIAAWPDIVAQYEADQLELRSGRRTRGQLILNHAYSNPAL